jgi:hypothetical protein
MVLHTAENYDCAMRSLVRQIALSFIGFGWGARMVLDTTLSQMEVTVSTRLYHGVSQKLSPADLPRMGGTGAE